MTKQSVKRHSSKRRSSKRRPSKRHSSKRRHGDKKFFQSLHKLKSMSSKHRCQALKMANNSFIRKFCTHIKKLRRMKMKPKQRKFLIRHKSNLKQLVSNKVPLTSKRKILTQKGGLFPLVPLLLSALAPVVGGIAKKVFG